MTKFLTLSIYYKTLQNYIYNYLAINYYCRLFFNYSKKNKKWIHRIAFKPKMILNNKSRDVAI